MRQKRAEVISWSFDEETNFSELDIVLQSDNLEMFEKRTTIQLSDYLGWNIHTAYIVKYTLNIIIFKK